MSGRPLVLTIGPTSRAGERVLRDALHDAAELRFHPDAGAALDDAPDAAVAIVGGPPLPEAFIERAQRLELVYRLGGAHAARDEAAALQARGVELAAPPPGLSAAATAEHTLALLLALTKRLPDGDRYVRAGNWRVPSTFDDTTRELSALTVGIVGMGHVGTHLAHLLAPFGTRILCARRTPADPAGRGSARSASPVSAANEDVERERSAPGPAKHVPMPELLQAADVVSLHVRAKPDTFRFGPHEFATMRPGSFFVNTARAHLVDHEALLHALDERLAGAALDVFPHEPHVDARLRAHPRVLLSPHAAGRTVEAAARYYGGAARAALAVVQRVAIGS